ncbi:MAG: hypothetical protein IJX98_03550 [Clostridia bacterium]|nr:hypothetical protein [Clostridia bacterium]
MLDFLPEELKNALKQVNLNNVYEIRIRAGQPTTVNYCGKYLYLTDFGVSESAKNAILAREDQIAETVFAAGKYSVYSVEEQLRQGFLTADGGARIGLAGRYVFEKGQPLTVRDFTSLCIRIPHEILGCAERLYESCFQDGLQHLLIGSPPGQGKTTLLRDLSRLISEKTAKNILICDERGEIAVGNTGASSDIFSFADKRTALEIGIRAMRPDVIVTDELTEADLPAVKRAIGSGVKVVASVHIGTIEELSEGFKGVFDRIAVLDGETIGKIKGIYDKRGEEMIRC